MTVALSVAVGAGRRGGRLRLDRQHVGVDGGVRRAGRHQAARAGAAGQDRGRQAGAGDHARRAGDHGARQLRRLPADVPRPRRALPGRAGQLRQPGAARGPEDRRLRDRRLPRRRPRRARACRSATPATSRRTGRATASTPTAGRVDPAARDAGASRPPAPRRSCRARRSPDPETVATAIRIGNPASWHLAVAARDESGGRFEAVTDEQILAAQRELAAARRRLRRAGLRGRCRRPARRASAEGTSTPASDRRHGHRPRAQGHRHRAVDVHRTLVDTVVDADVDGRARPAAWAALSRRFVARPGHGARPGHQRQPRPRLRRARPRARPPRRPSPPRSSTRRARRSRSRARGRATSRATSGTSSYRSMRRGVRAAWASRPPGLAARLHQRHPARPRAGLVVRGDRRGGLAGPGAGRGRLAAMDDDARLRARAPSSRATPTTWRLRCSAGSRRLAATAARFRAASAGRRPARPGRSCSCRRTASRPTVARGLLPATVPHADAAANAGRAALLVAALTAARAAARRRPRTACTRSYRAPAMPESLALVRRAARRRPAGGRSRVPARPCWCFTDGQQQQDVAGRCPEGWTALIVPIDRDGARVDLPE